MLTSGFGSARQSLDASNPQPKRPENVPHRDSDGAQAHEYSMDVELSDHNKKMLEQFKITSGFYNTSPKKNKKAISPKKAKKEE